MATYNVPPLGPGWQLQAIVARYRFSETLAREVVGLLEDAYRALAARLVAGPVLSSRDRTATEDRFLEIRALLTEAYEAAQRSTGATLREYAALEREIAARQLQAMAAVRSASLAGALASTPADLALSVGAPNAVAVVTQGLPRQLIVSAARLTEVVQTIDVGGIGFGAWWEKAREDGILRVRRTIQTGVAQGLHPTDIARHIWASGATKGPNAWRQSRTVAETVARTVVGTLQTDAQLAAEAQFPQVVRGYVFRAVLDARTSSICRSLADTEWKAGDPRLPVPPLHPNCRSALEPIVDVPGIGRTTSQQPTYEAWLRTQPVGTQEAILGRGIAAHWRGGKAPLADLLTVDRRSMTLAQLRTALYSADPASYVGWLAALPATTQRAVLGPALAKRLASGAASLEEILAASAGRGIITRDA